MTARALICDQLPLVRDGLRTLLDALPDVTVVATTDDVREAVVLSQTHRPEAVLIGVTKIEVSIDLVRNLIDETRYADHVAQCLVFYSELTRELLAELLQAGVRGLLRGWFVKVCPL